MIPISPVSRVFQSAERCRQTVPGQQRATSVGCGRRFCRTGVIGKLLSTYVVTSTWPTRPALARSTCGQAIGKANMAREQRTQSRSAKRVFNTPQTITLDQLLGQLRAERQDGDGDVRQARTKDVTISGNNASRVFQVNWRCHGVDLRDRRSQKAMSTGGGGLTGQLMAARPR